MKNFIKKILQIVAPFYYAKRVISKVFQLPDESRINMANYFKNLEIEGREYYEKKYKANYEIVLIGEDFSNTLVQPIFEAMISNSPEKVVYILEKLKNLKPAQVARLRIEKLNLILLMVEKRTKIINNFLDIIKMVDQNIKDSERWAQERPSDRSFWLGQAEQFKRRRARIQQEYKNLLGNFQHFKFS